MIVVIRIDLLPYAKEDRVVGYALFRGATTRFGPTRPCEKWGMFRNFLTNGMMVMR